MLVDGAQFKDVYDAVIVDKHQSEDKNILLFVGHSDVDAVCAVKQLQKIFTTDESPFSQNPIGSYEELQQACESIKDATDLRTIFCINCGATENVRRICGFEHNPMIRLVIIDSHRPIWHGYNDNDRNTLVLLDRDDPVPAAQVPTWQHADDYLRAGEDIYLKFLRDTSGEADDSEEEDLDPEASPSAHKRRRTCMDAEAKQRRQLLLHYYAEKSGFGKPSSLLLYSLLHNLHLDTIFSLWLGVLGLTDQLVHQRISRQDYDKWRRGMELHLQQHGAAMAAAMQDSNDAQQRHDQIQVVRSADTRLTLLRTWSLLDALMYSSYTAARMQTWTERGRSNVKLLISTMSIEQEESVAQYSIVEHKYRDKLHAKLERHGVDFGLNMRAQAVEGFELRYKNDVPISASDTVLLLTMVLGRAKKDATQAKMDFHDAAELLEVQQVVDRVKKGILQVQHICKTVVLQGGQAIQRRQVQGYGRNSKFWFLDISSLDFTHKQDFEHPATLQHLAIFLRDAMGRRHNTHKAMVVVGPPDAEGQCYVVALRAKETPGVMQNNPFARPFEEVVDSLGLSMKRSTFDSTLYLLHRADVGPFLEELKVIIARYEAEANMAQLAAE